MPTGRLSAVATRIEDSTVTVPVVRASSRPRPAARKNFTASQRILFVFALVTFGLASTYSSIALLARVTPALFPGKDLTNIGILRPLASLDNPLFNIQPPSDSSVFN